MRNDLRKKLLADYAMALVEERTSWERLREPDLTEAERCRTFGEWKQTASRLKTLARHLREAEPPAASLAPAAADAAPIQEQACAVHPQFGRDVAQSMPPPALQWLVRSTRLVTTWLARTHAGLARVGSP